MSCGWRRAASAVTLTLITTILPACTSAPADGAGRAVIRDSSGVEIVEHGGLPAVREVTSAPLVDIGGNEQVPEYDIGPVTGAVFLGDGRIAVANQGTNEVRFYDSTGTWIVSSGRAGDGPGEYRALFGLWVGTADSLLAFDFTRQSLSVLTPSGDFVRLITIGSQASAATVRSGGFAFAQPTGVLGDGSILAARQISTIAQAQQGISRDTLSLIRFAPDASVLDTVTVALGPEMEYLPLTVNGQSMNTPTPVPFGRNTIVAAGSSGVFVARNDRFEIEVRGADGTVRRIVRVKGDPVSISNTEAETHRTSLREQMLTGGLDRLPESIQQQFLQRIDKASYPATYPWIESIIPGANGTIWVQTVQRPGTEVREYVVFDSTGALVDRLRMPPGVRVMAVGLSRALGLWKDEDDVQHVRVYQIQ